MFIDANKDDHVEGRRLGVEPICQVLQMAQSTYYAAKDRVLWARSVRDEVLIPQLVALWVHSFQVYGARKLWKVAHRAGLDVGRDQTARLMRVAGVQGASRSRRIRTTRPDLAAVRHPDLVKRHFTATGANQVVGHGPDVRADLGRRGVRLLDHRRLLPHDRRVAVRLEYAHFDGARCHRDGPLVQRPATPRVAVSQRRRVPITSVRYGERLAEIGATPSIGAVGDGLDNALTETINGYHKAELSREERPLVRG